MKKSRILKTYKLDPELDQIFSMICKAKRISMTRQIEKMIKKWTSKNRDAINEIQKRVMANVA